MDNSENSKNKVAEIIEEAKNIAVMSSKVAGLDAYCAGAAIYHMLKEKEKEVVFIYPGKIPEGGEDLIPENEITGDVTKRNLLVSIDYSGTGASKVNYSTDNGVLYINIGPVSADYNQEGKIQSRITGFSFDAIIVVGAQNLYDLGQSYRNLDASSRISKIVNLDITDRNSRFGLVDIIEPSVSSLSLLTFQQASGWKLTPNVKAAKAILSGIQSKEPPYKG